MTPIGLQKLLGHEVIANSSSEEKSIIRRQVLISCPIGFALLLAGCDSGETVQPPPPMEPEEALLDVAGPQGVAGNGGDGGLATACSLYWPIDVTITEEGEALVVDMNNHRIQSLRRGV